MAGQKLLDIIYDRSNTELAKARHHASQIGILGSACWAKRPAGGAVYQAARTVETQSCFCNLQQVQHVMERQKIEVAEYANSILQALPKGILLTSKSGERINSMTIGWGTLGTVWSKPIFMALVREHRFTRELLDKNPEFTISVPVGEYSKKIIAICGSKCGRNLDKISEAGITLVEPELISVPAVKELPLTLECRIVYQQKQELAALIEPYRSKSYPQHVDGAAVGANRDAHIAYYGEIVSAYILK